MILTYELTMTERGELALLLRANGHLLDAAVTTWDDYGARIVRGLVAEARSRGFSPRYSA